MRGLVIIKPDSEKYLDEIVKAMTKVNVNLVRGFKIQIPRETIEILYNEHKGSSIYQKLIDYMSGGMSIVLILEGNDTVNKLLEIKGKANKGGIRGKYAYRFDQWRVKNILHCPDTEEQTEKEIALLIDANEQQ